MLLLAHALQSAAPGTRIDCASAAQAACTTFVYFDSGEGTAIRADWDATLDAVATRLRSGAALTVDAYSDRSGPASVNHRLSMQRANAVLAALAKRGIKAGRITITYHGEENVPVPTPDGVREAQNRTVELTVGQ